MRIKIIQAPTVRCIDGIRLDHFVSGFQYEVGNVLGSYLIAERWAVPVDDHAPALLTPLSEFDADAETEAMPVNLTREFYPPYYDGPQSVALDRRRRRRLK